MRAECPPRTPREPAPEITELQQLRRAAIAFGIFLLVLVVGVAVMHQLVAAYGLGVIPRAAALGGLVAVLIAALGERR